MNRTPALRTAGYALIALLSGRNSHAIENLAWSVCVQEASRANSEIAAARDNLQAAHYNTRGSYSGFFPQVTAATGFTRSGTGSTSSPTDAYSASLSASETLFSGFQDRAKVTQALANERAAQASFDIVRNRVSTDLKSAFANLVYGQRSVKLQLDIAKRRDENLRLVELRFDSGRENKGSVLLSRAYLDQAHYESLQAKNGIQVAQAQLARVLGRDDDAEIVAVGDVPVNEVSNISEFKNLASLTPEHRQSVAQADAAESSITLARTGFYPSLALNGSLSRTGTTWFPNSDKWSVGLNLSLPLFSGGRDYYASKSAVESFSAAIASRQNVDRVTLSRLKQTYTALGEAAEKLKVDESFLRAATARAEIARNQYNNGLISFADWDLIENDLISRQKTVLQSQRDRITAEAAWEQAIGKGVIP